MIICYKNFLKKFFYKICFNEACGNAFGRDLVMIKEFKEFAMRGNVLDLAIGVIIGGAFGNIVSSFVNDIIMPLLSLLTNGNDISELEIVLQGGENPAVFRYGAFLQNILDFLLIAVAIFIFIKLINKFKKKLEEAQKEMGLSKEEPEAATEEPEQPEEPELTKQEQLLEEIRDLLKK